jgi:D-inositol-3-phosphate glycosyltransferase
MTDEETGLIVPRDDHEAMAEAAIRLLEDSELAVRLARNARESARRFTWQEVQRQWLDLYLELAAGESRISNFKLQISEEQ